MEQSRRGRKPSPELRAAIVAAAQGLFAARGVEAATTREIAALAGTTERTLFKHFGSKQRLVQAVIEEVSGAMVRQAAFARVWDPSPFTHAAFIDWHRGFLADRVAAAEAAPDAYKVLLREMLRDDAFRRRYAERWMEGVFAPLVRHIAAMQEAGEIAAHLSPRALAGAFFSLNLGYLVSRFVLLPETGWAGDGDVEAIVSLFAAACRGEARPRRRGEPQ